MAVSADAYRILKLEVHLQRKLPVSGDLSAQYVAFVGCIVYVILTAGLGIRFAYLYLCLRPSRSGCRLRIVKLKGSTLCILVIVLHLVAGICLDPLSTYRYISVSHYSVVRIGPSTEGPFSVYVSILII